MSIAQHTDILEQLRHRCCICSQWVANIRSIKLHVLKVHPEFYNTAGAAALADCRKIGHLISPCRYCGAQVSKASQHASTCPVLWQLRLGAILTNPATSNTTICGDGHGPGRGHSVSIPPPPEEAGPLRGAAHHRRKASEVASLASSQRKRQQRQQHQGSSGGSGLDATVKALARLTLRQGDYIARLKTDHTVLMTFNLEENPSNIIPALAGVAENGTTCASTSRAR